MITNAKINEIKDPIEIIIALYVFKTFEISYFEVPFFTLLSKVPSVILHVLLKVPSGTNCSVEKDVVKSRVAIVVS